MTRELDASLTDEQRAAVDRMSPQERIDAMEQHRLSLGQLGHWTRQHQDQVPLAGREFEWILRYDPDYCEPTAHKQPQR